MYIKELSNACAVAYKRKADPMIDIYCVVDFRFQNQNHRVESPERKMLNNDKALNNYFRDLRTMWN